MSFPVTFEVILRISSIGTEVFLLMDDAEHVPLIDDSGLKVRDDKENVVDVKAWKSGLEAEEDIQTLVATMVSCVPQCSVPQHEWMHNGLMN